MLEPELGGWKNIGDTHIVTFTQNIAPGRLDLPGYSQDVLASVAETRLPVSRKLVNLDLDISFQSFAPIRFWDPAV